MSLFDLLDPGSEIRDQGQVLSRFRILDLGSPNRVFEILVTFLGIKNTIILRQCDKKKFSVPVQKYDNLQFCKIFGYKRR
jgi:hypothetical protein